MPSLFSNVIKSLKKLPGVGPRLAERIAFHVIDMPKEELDVLVKNLVDFKKKIQICPICGLISEQSPCRICSSSQRNRACLCIVKNIQDAFSLEKSKAFDGLYHVLSAINQLGSEIVESELSLEPLLERMKDVREIIFALEPSLESELAIKEITKRLANHKVKFSRLAIGIPTGVSLEYIDETTMKNAVSNRTSL